MQRRHSRALLPKCTRAARLQTLSFLCRSVRANADRRSQNLRIREDKTRAPLGGPRSDQSVVVVRAPIMRPPPFRGGGRSPFRPGNSGSSMGTSRGMAEYRVLASVLQAFLSTDGGISRRPSGRRCLADHHLRTWCPPNKPPRASSGCGESLLMRDQGVLGILRRFKPPLVSLRQLGPRALRTSRQCGLPAQRMLDHC